MAGELTEADSPQEKDGIERLKVGRPKVDWRRRCQIMVTEKITKLFSGADNWLKIHLTVNRRLNGTV